MPPHKTALTPLKHACIAMLFCCCFGATKSLAMIPVPEIVFASKLLQPPKPYIGAGFLFSSLAPGRSEDFYNRKFGSGLSQFRNLTVHAGIRINGFVAVEFAYARPYKSIYVNGENHHFSGELLSLAGLVYPVSLDFGLFSLEPYVKLGLAYIVNAKSSYTQNNVTINDSFNNTANIVYGVGLQIGFIKYVSLRCGVDAMSPLNGQPFGYPYGSVMLTYGLTASLYPV